MCHEQLVKALGPEHVSLVQIDTKEGHALCPAQPPASLSHLPAMSFQRTCNVFLVVPTASEALLRLSACVHLADVLSSHKPSTTASFFTVRPSCLTYFGLVIPSTLISGQGFVSTTPLNTHWAWGWSNMKVGSDLRHPESLHRLPLTRHPHLGCCRLHHGATVFVDLVHAMLLHQRPLMSTFSHAPISKPVIPLGGCPAVLSALLSETVCAGLTA